MRLVQGISDFDPDLILADVFLPGKSGMEICRHVKNDQALRHMRVVLTAGLLEPFDEDEAKRAGCDAILKKPFEVWTIPLPLQRGQVS
jgi:CheY-like chemotaxis protein